MSKHKKKKKKKRFGVKRIRASTYAELGELTDVNIMIPISVPKLNINYTLEHLQEMVKNGNDLIKRELHDAPGKLGHSEDQKFAQLSGLPAIGWITEFKLMGERIIAKFSDVPDMVIDAFKKGLYKKISPEIYDEFPDPETGENMGHVIRAVAFLGADVPQQKGLAAFLKDEAGVYALAEEGEDHKFSEVTINVTIPDSPEEPEPELPPIKTEAEIKAERGLKPLDPDKMEEFDLMFFRQAEEAVKGMLDSQIEEIDKEQSVEGLIRWVGRVGFDGCKTNAVIRSFPDADGLCSWLWARAFERGLVAEVQPNILNEEEEMDKDKIIADLKLEVSKLSDNATSSAEEKATLQARLTKLEDDQKANKEAQAKMARATSLADVEAFANKDEYKEILTPALKMELTALAEAVGVKDHVIKLDEKGSKTETISGPKLLVRFTENLIKAKIVKLEETAKTKKEGNSGSDASKMEGADYAELDEKAQALVKSDAKLSKLAETQPNAAYMDAVKIVQAESPELAQREGA